MKPARRALIIGVASILSLVLSAYGLFLVSKSRTFQFFGGLTDRVATDQKIVALTFDDAPSATTTQQVLDILKAKDTKATFYVIGQNAEAYPDQLKAIVDAGDEVGDHSYSHHRFLLKSQDFIRTEIEKTDHLIREAGYTGKITFRPPNGKKLFGLPWYLAQHGIQTIMWDVEPDTYHPGDAEGIAQYVLDKARPGSIILMHPFCDEACAADREALPRIIDGLASQGYRFVTVSELLTYK